MLRELTNEVWAADVPNRFYGLAFGSRMVIVRLSDGSLFMHSPISIDDAMKAAIDTLGPVAHIVAPNIYHHMHAKAASELYPEAKVHVAAGLDKKRPDLHADVVLSAVQDPGWRGEIEGLPVDGYVLNETAFLHHPSGTLICSDLLENFEGADDWYTRVFLKLNGVYGRPGVSRALRMAFRDKRAARKSIDAVLERSFERVVVGHGEPILDNGREVLREGYTWLRV